MFINSYLLCILSSTLVASVVFSVSLLIVFHNVDVVVCHKVPVLAMLVGGSWFVLGAVLDRVRSKVPVLVIRHSGPAANFIADFSDREDRGEERSVFQQLYRCLR